MSGIGPAALEAICDTVIVINILIIMQIVWVVVNVVGASDQSHAIEARAVHLSLRIGVEE